MEDPVDRVIVVTDGCDKEDHQLARPPRLILRRDAVEVLPQNAAIALVETDRVLEVERFAKVIGHDYVEQRRIVRGVPPGFERACQPANSAFADVKRAAPAPVDV